MKKMLLLCFIIIFLFTSCNKAEVNIPGNIEDKDIYNVKDFFPVKENTKYTYVGEGNEFAAYTVFIDYINGDRFQTRTNNGATEYINVYEFSDGRLTELYQRGETYFREDFTKREFGNGNILMQDPDAANFKQIVTPMGNYNALEIENINSDSTVLNYYAKDIGLIKTINKGEGYVVSTALSNIEQDVPLIQTVDLYYPDIDGEHLRSVDVQISFDTNDSAKDVIEKTVKDLSVYELFSTNTQINNLYFDENSDSVHIDLSKDFVDEMNAGAGFENLILQSIANTLGAYYGVTDVYLTIEGNLYESGHIVLMENEPLKADFSNVVNQ